MKFIFCLALICFFHFSLFGQTRLNTEKLETKLKNEIKQSEQTLKTFERELKSLREASHQRGKKRNHAEKRLQQIDAEITKIRKEKIESFKLIIAELMDDVEIGHLLREKPHRIFLVKWIEEAIVKQPWLLEPILEHLNTYP